MEQNKEINKLQENELDPLDTESSNDDYVQEPKQEKDEEPRSLGKNPEEFCELNYKGFNFKIGSSVIHAQQLAEISIQSYNLITGKKDTPKPTSYTQ